MTQHPTVEDVARLAGVSRQTVSNVLNSPEVVRPVTRDRVARAIAELGYRPHAAARRLRTQRSSTIGIHLDPYAGGISGVVLDRFVHALTEHATARDMRVLLYAARSPEEEISQLEQLTRTGEIDAAIVTGTFHGDPRTRWLTEHDFPFVSFGRPWGDDDVAAPDHLWVDVDGAAGTRAATAHAVATAGARVAFLGWPRGSGTGDDRERGWREQIGPVAGSASAPRLTTDNSVTAGRERTQRALQEHDLDAIVCVSDAVAIGAHMAAVAAGRQELPVIGFDNTPSAEALSISSIEQLPEKVARGALELLMGATGKLISPRITAPGEAHILVEPRLVVR